jgi:hypothetical protein
VSGDLRCSPPALHANGVSAVPIDLKALSKNWVDFAAGVGESRTTPSDMIPFATLRPITGIEVDIALPRDRHRHKRPA